MNTILVVAAHPDDEILGVGGTMARRAAEGDAIYALILGEGQTSRWRSRELADAAVIGQLHKNTLDAAEVIGFSKVFFENLPDNRFDSVDLLDIVKKVENYIEDIQPNIIYTHHFGDLNIDHRLTFEAVITATRPTEKCKVKEIYAFETVSSSEWSFGDKERSFCPNVFVDIEKYFNLKCDALSKYESEVCEFPHPRSMDMLDALAKKRGSTVGKHYAEAFELIRMVN